MIISIAFLITASSQVFDSAITDTLMEEMQKHGPAVQPGSDVKELVSEADSTISVCLKNGLVHPGYDTVLFAIGRHPATSGIGLEECGVQMEKGFIKVDEYECTNIPGLYALGDATTSGWELTPVAIAAGRRLADRLYGGEPLARMVYSDVPTVIFSHPVIGQVGYTEAAALKKSLVLRISVC